MLKRLTGRLGRIGHVLGRVARWHGRLLLWLLGLVALVLAVAATAWQFYFVPRLDEFRPQIVAALSSASGVPLQLNHIEGGWRGGRPRLTMEGVSVLDARHVPALQLARLDADLTWWSLFVGKLHFKQLRLEAPRVSLSRDAEGRLHLGSLALHTAQDGQDNRFVDWLLEQGEVRLSGGELVWDDALTQAGPQRFANVSFVLSNWLGQHRVKLSLTPPAAIASPVTLSGRFSGKHLARLATWRGSLDLQIDRADLAQVWSQIPEARRPFPALSGQAGGRLSFDFAGGRIGSAQLSLKGQDWTARIGDAPITLARFDGRFALEQRDKLRRIDINITRADGRDGLLCNGCSLSYSETAGDQRRIRARGWQLETLPAYLPMLPKAWAEQVASLRLAGQLKDGELSWAGDAGKPGHYSGRMVLAGATVAGVAGWPGVSGADVWLQFDEKRGELQLTSPRFGIEWPSEFAEPLVFDKAAVEADWRREGEEWRIDLPKLAFENRDITLDLKANYRYRNADDDLLDVSGRIGRLTAQRAYAYLPREAGAETLAWLKHSLKAGQGLDGKVVVHGPLAKFPFPDDRGGRFQITALARGVTLDFADGWPPISNIDGVLDFHGNRMDIRADSGAKILGTSLSKVHVAIADLAHQPLLEIDGSAGGKTSDFLDFLRQSPLHAHTAAYVDGLKAEGSGELTLKLGVPLDNPDATRVDGRFQYADNQLDFGAGVPLLTRARGELGFTERSFELRNGAARIFGGDSRVSGKTGADGKLRLQLAGQVQLAEVMRRYPMPLGGNIKGAVAYQGQLDLGDDGYTLNVQSPLMQAEVDLPAPLGKRVGDVRLLRLQLAGDPKGSRIDFGYGNLLAGALRLPDSGASSGQIVLGSASAAAPTKPGFAISGSWPALDVQAWAKVAPSGARDDVALALSGDVQIGQLSGWGRQLNAVRVRFTGDGRNWQSDVSARELAGKLGWDGNGNGKLSAQLQRLALPLGETAQGTAPQDSAHAAASGVRKLPALDIAIGDLRYKSLQLGRMAVLASQQGEDWRLDKVELVNPDLNLVMNGSWRQGSHVNGHIEASTPSTGNLLGRLGYPDTVKRAPAKFSGDLTWDGPLFPPDLSSMRGTMSLDVGAGQFAKIDPGVARFLSVLSLQALSRRVQLDFRDVFSSGFEFDAITGQAKIDKGIAQTDDLVIAGPAAQVLFRGNANFVAGTQNLRVRIVPVIGDTVAIATGIINPVVGVAAFLLQRALKDPLGQLVAYEYDISGTMSDPQIRPTRQSPADRLYNVEQGMRR
ncbi:YhdP family protein [Jeongeupia naejangsanensis]|uniref:TIGR02099 family protein n=1 Tax=Jeongeupia naejangsanensis TaxID=613195 RepID=A0ABS2BLD5_9NEIS|nr:YhdP family protein [Jeongeupia naejangsanensis]MBM3116260.1 TIGR02099 family protein [Jeongeupia naejangsanensis]